MNVFSALKGTHFYSLFGTNWPYCKEMLPKDAARRVSSADLDKTGSYMSKTLENNSLFFTENLISFDKKVYLILHNKQVNILIECICCAVSSIS